MLAQVIQEVQVVREVQEVQVVREVQGVQVIQAVQTAVEQTGQTIDTRTLVERATTTTQE